MRRLADVDWVSGDTGTLELWTSSGELRCKLSGEFVGWLSRKPVFVLRNWHKEDLVLTHDPAWGYGRLVWRGELVTPEVCRIDVGLANQLVGNYKEVEGWLGAEDVVAVPDAQFLTGQTLFDEMLSS